MMDPQSFQTAGPRLVTEKWERTVMVTSKRLLKGFGIRAWCDTNSCTVSFLEDPIDIIAIPYFAAIFDPEALINGTWALLNDVEQVGERELALAGPGKASRHNGDTDVTPTLIWIGSPDAITLPGRGTLAFIHSENRNLKSLLACLLDHAKLNCLMTESHRLRELRSITKKD